MRIKNEEFFIEGIGTVKRYARSRFEKITGIHIITNHRGKMCGNWSLSTSVLHNKYCEIRRKVKDFICNACYAAAMASEDRINKEYLKKNTDILTAGILTAVPEIKNPYGIFRFESFGDLNNMVQFINYLIIARVNPDITFALWSKNLWFIKAAFDLGIEKPKNLIIIQSSHCINKPEKKRYDFVDKVFTVFTREYAEKNNITIHCHKSVCVHCMKCYLKNNSLVYINELLKSEG